MKNGKQFSADLGAWAKKAGDKLDALARQVCQEVSYRAVTNTPVDTGFLRSSWQPSIGAPQAAVGAAGAQGAPLAAVSLVCAGVKVGDIFWMTNNARYAKFVEYGTSKMAGRFFTTDAATQWNSIVQKVVGELALK